MLFSQYSQNLRTTKKNKYKTGIKSQFMQKKNQQGLKTPNIDEDDMFQYGGFVPDNKTNNNKWAKLDASKQSDKEAGQ